MTTTPMSDRLHLQDSRSISVMWSFRRDRMNGVENPIFQSAKVRDAPACRRVRKRSSARQESHYAALSRQSVTL